MANRILDTQRASGGNAILDTQESSGIAAITATASWTEGSEVFAMAATVAQPGVTAVASWTEGGETFAMTATVAAPAGISATAAWTEGDEVFSMVGTVAAAPITANAAWTEGSEIFTMTGEVAGPIGITVVAGWTEAPEIFSMNMTLESPILPIIVTLVPEDGSGRPDADSYGSIAEADAYHAALGNSAWAAVATIEKERNLRKATNFMRQIYRAKWSGRRVYQVQALDWPRFGVCADGFPVLSTVVPVDVKHACFELALRAAAGPLLEDVDTGSSQIKKDKTGPLETEYFEAHVDPSERFIAIGAMLQPYFGGAGGSNSIKLVRG